MGSLDLPEKMLITIIMVHNFLLIYQSKYVKIVLKKLLGFKLLTPNTVNLR